MLLRFGPAYRPAPPRLVGRRIHLRPPLYRDHAGWAALRARSRAFLQPWEPTWEAEALSFAAYRARIGRLAAEWREDRGYGFFLLAGETRQVLGGITLSHVRRGVAQAANLGYWMGEEFAGRGYMREALGLLLPYAFAGLGLHRLDAACIPENARSRRLLQRAGFTEIGQAPLYLKIDGSWRDHVLYSIVGERFVTAGVEP